MRAKTIRNVIKAPCNALPPPPPPCSPTNSRKESNEHTQRPQAPDQAAAVKDEQRLKGGVFQDRRRDSRLSPPRRRLVKYRGQENLRTALGTRRHTRARAKILIKR